MKPKQIWTFGAITLMFIIAFSTVALGVLPNIAQISVLNESRYQTRDDNIIKLTYLADLKLKAADKSSLLVALEKKRQMIPIRLANVEFMDELKTIADHHGVVVEKLSTTRPQQYLAPAPIKANPLYQQSISELGSKTLFVSNVSFSLGGKMIDIARSLADLNDGARFVLITRIVVPKAAGLGDSAVVADFTAQIFTLSSE